jgi:signal transduction histidine kinase
MSDSSVGLAELPRPVRGRLALAIGLQVVAGCRRRRAAERTRAEEDRRRAGEERLRIARELHDVLAHNLALINVQAGVALHLMDEQPGQSRSALVAIKQASNDALKELRSVLDVLRQGKEQPPRASASGLAHLNSLVAGASATGLKVRTRVEGTPGPCPPVSTWPPSGSCRRRSPTSPATPARPAPPCWSATAARS